MSSNGTHRTVGAFAYLNGPLRSSRKSVPTFEFKSGSPDHTGGGYARIRTEEERPDKPGDALNTAFVPIHRLAAVVWCYPADKPLDEIQRDMLGKDVHHTLGMPSANGEEWLDLRDHGEHASITNAQKRAFAEDAKRARDGEWTPAERDVCDSCRIRDAAASLAGDDSDETYCVECATEAAHGTDHTIEIL